MFYINPQQKTNTNGFADRFEPKLVKKIIIDGTSISAELPDDGIVNGTIEFFNTIETDDEKRAVYQIATGGLLSINDNLSVDNWDCIIINLLSTPTKKIYTF